jgi:hypothetical protein
MAENAPMLSQLLVISALVLLSGCKTIDETVAKIEGNAQKETTEQQKTNTTPVSLDRCSKAIARVNVEQDVNFVGRLNQEQYADNVNSKILENIIRQSQCFTLVRKHEEYELKFTIVPLKHDYSEEGSLLGMAGIAAAPITMGFTGLMAIGVAPAVAGMSVAKMDVNVGVEIVRQSDGHYTNIEHKSVAGDDYYRSELLFSNSGSGAEWETSEDGKRILAAIIPAVNKTISWIRGDKGISSSVLTGRSHGGRDDLVFKIQSALSKIGYTIHADGLYGPRTKEIIGTYQKANNLTVDGRATPELLEHLQRQ